jgi:hypothetical protein
MRTIYFLFSMVLAIATVAPSAFADKVVVRAKATVASVTAKRDAMNKVRDELRAFAAKSPGRLTAAEKKTHDEFLLKVKEITEGADAISKKLTEGLREKNPKLDSMSEMGETESLRLQMIMDRQQKLMQTISNLMKKQSDTASAIVSNLK